MGVVVVASGSSPSAYIRGLIRRIDRGDPNGIFDRHIFDNFVAAVIRETNILVIFNVFMQYSALISSKNMMFNDEIYNNGGRPHFDF